MFQNVDFYTYSEIIEMGEMVIVNNYTIFSRNYYLVIGVYQDYTYIVPCIYLIFLKKGHSYVTLSLSSSFVKNYTVSS